MPTQLICRQPLEIPSASLSPFSCIHFLFAHVCVFVCAFSSSSNHWKYAKFRMNGKCMSCSKYIYAILIEHTKCNVTILKQISFRKLVVHSIYACLYAVHMWFISSMRNPLEHGNIVRQKRGHYSYPMQWKFSADHKMLQRIAVPLRYAHAYRSIFRSEKKKYIVYV